MDVIPREQEDGDHRIWRWPSLKYHHYGKGGNLVIRLDPF